MSRKRIPILSFFSGGGFLDMGFEQAGFRVVWANERNPRFIEMYKHGYSAWRRATRIGCGLPYLENRPVEELTPSKVIYRSFPSTTPNVFGIIAGPPCPDFSNAGRHAGHSGENGKLTKYYVDLICQIRPTFFVLENVAGFARMKKHRPYFNKIIRLLENSGYLTDYSVLNALDYGVPQRRERLFLVGFKNRVARKYANGNDITREHWFPWPIKTRYSNAEHAYLWPSTNKFGTTPNRPKGIPPELFVGTHLVSKKDRNRVANANDFFRPYSKKFLEVAEGDTSQKSFKRLHRYRFSPTACYGNNEVHLHPTEPRRLSLRESMRIQGIPDQYVLPEDVKLQPAFKMVSNGVPVPLAKNVALAIMSVLNKAT